MKRTPRKCSHIQKINFENALTNDKRNPEKTAKNQANLCMVCKYSKIINDIKTPETSLSIFKASENLACTELQFLLWLLEFKVTLTENHSCPFNKQITVATVLFDRK